MITVAEEFAEILATAGVKRIYGIVGDSLNGLTDAIRKQGKIEWLHLRREIARAVAFGFQAKAAIHPGQIASRSPTLTFGML